MTLRALKAELSHREPIQESNNEMHSISYFNCTYLLPEKAARSRTFSSSKPKPYRRLRLKFWIINILSLCKTRSTS